MYHIQHLSYSFKKTPILKNISLSITKGKYIILMGENGQGKSTFINLITGFLQPTEGAILFKGQNLEEIHKDTKKKQSFYAQLGILFQDVDMQLFNQTVYDELAFGLRQIPFDEEQIKVRIEEVSQLLGIHHLLERVPYQLSGGEKKKVAFASIFILNPSVYILDEPFNHLAKEAQDQLYEILQLLRKAGKTIIISTHHYHHIPSKEADVILFKNQTATYITEEDIKSNPSTQELLSKY